jgi:hypothetical protein
MEQSIQLSLKTKWFEMTKEGIKTEDYRELNSYWCNKLLLHRGKIESRRFWQMCYFDILVEDSLKKFYECHIIHQITSVPFNQNIMTLGYPKSTDTSRILKFEHKGIEIRTGNPEWGAEPNKLYFVIKHGNSLT